MLDLNRLKFWPQLMCCTTSYGHRPRTFSISIGRRHIRAGNTYNWLHRPDTSVHAAVMATICLFISDVIGALVVSRCCPWTREQTVTYLVTDDYFQFLFIRPSFPKLLQILFESNFDSINYSTSLWTALYSSHGPCSWRVRRHILIYHDALYWSRHLCHGGTLPYRGHFFVRWGAKPFLPSQLIASTEKSLAKRLAICAK